MKKTFVCVLLIACAMTAAVDLGEELDDMLDNNLHRQEVDECKKAADEKYQACLSEGMKNGNDKKSLSNTWRVCGKAQRKDLARCARRLQKKGKRGDKAPKANNKCRRAAAVDLANCLDQANKLNTPAEWEPAVKACRANWENANNNCANRNLDVSTQKHMGWCQVKAVASRTWCLTKAYASLDAVARKTNVARCHLNHQAALNACPKRLLSSATPTEDFESHFLAEAPKHKSWCSFKASTAQIWCKTKAQMTSDPIKRQVAKDNCDYNLNLALQRCPQRRLTKMAHKGASWCLVKAHTALNACKAWAWLTWNTDKRNANLNACDAKWKAAAAACPPARRLNVTGQKHKSWCSFKASVALRWCQSKAVLTRDAVQRKNNLNQCTLADNLARQKCAQRRLDQLMTTSSKHKSFCTFKAQVSSATCKMLAWTLSGLNKEAREAKLRECQNKLNAQLANCPKRLLATGRHGSWCGFKVAVAHKWCQTKALWTTDALQRKANLEACNYQKALAAQKCPARMLDKETSDRMEEHLTETVQKHKSWCTFKAAGARSWCKLKAWSWRSEVRNAGYIACDNAYNLAVAQCAQRRLMKDFEKTMMAGNAHEGWCEFKNRSQWLWCKTRKSINLNADARRGALAKCDTVYNAGDAACKAAKLLAAPAHNAANIVTPGN